MAEERLMSYLLPEIPELAGLVYRAGQVGIPIRSQAYADDVSRVTRKIRRLLIRLQIPDASLNKMVKLK